MSIPQALHVILRRDHPDCETVIPTVVATLVANVFIMLGLDDPRADSLPEAAIIAALGGQQYVAEVLRWSRAKAAVGLNSPVT